MKLYCHPISAYSQKALTAFYEKGVQFDIEIVSVRDPVARAEYKKLTPLGKMPLLVLDDGHKIPESTIIIEYLENEHGSKGTRLISEDKTIARQTRFHDRNFDQYLTDSMTTIFFDGRQPEADREPKRVAGAKATLDTMFAMYDKHFATRAWAMGDDFSMADCAAAPALGYLRMVYPVDNHKNLLAYANRLFERPSFHRVLEEAKPMLEKIFG